ncbi:FAD-dependent oxidoreductase [Gordonibacter massiliensis (ex Traore et al. 2017)]|uniref:FAD-dependent oxidoreductase n=1 Tax=Gordonibacter massiliensis (ex Traore et al. 2017) TaxID=1841863 RepID=UPI001C8B17CA|nr:FAD-dependent oxidoreductase [Gordonibacter massiliensis (ex Traore et al. 2017)]MBX9033364.1 FAD-dependent oxidoreductase [Gordonibacter massiliensis (ex Traore et al. 2017)]
MERRAFFKLIGAGAVIAAGGAMTACSSSGGLASPLAPAPSTDEGPCVADDPEVSFSSEADVLVVGSGIAGLSAAMAPLEAHRSVMIVDKLELLGGESYSATGVMYVSGSALQKRAGIATTTEQAWDARKQAYADAGIVDLDFAKRLFTTAPEWVDHLVDDYGAQFEDPSDYVKAGASEGMLLPKRGLGDMESVMTPLRDGLSAKGASFSTGLVASAFVVDESGAVCGVRFRDAKSNAVTDVSARVVVVATGGFASSQPLVHANVPSQERIGCYTTASMGEGQLLCVHLGGQLADMNKPAPLTSDLPQAAAWGLFGPVLIVDALGRRFAREDDMNAAADACVADDRGYWWTVFGKGLSSGAQARSIAQVTTKNAKRMVGPFDDVEALAGGLGLPADALKATFDGYGALVDAGKDADFGRTAFLQKIEPPYYALKQFPVRYKTRGGVRTDAEGRLLNAAGSAIANVYACGSVAAGSVEGLATNGAFGLIVGRAVAKALDERDDKKTQAATPS